MIGFAGVAVLAAMASTFPLSTSDEVSCANDSGVLAEVSSATEVSAMACLEHDDLTVFLTREREGNSVPVQMLRIFGKASNRPDGPDVEIYVDRAGQGPIDLTWNGETAPLFISDFNGDGHDALAVGAFVEEPTLILYTLKDDPFEFLGRIFFFHAEGYSETSYLTAWGVSQITLGNPITVCDGRGRLRRYEAPDEYSYRLSFDSYGTDTDCRTP